VRNKTSVAGKRAEKGGRLDQKWLTFRHQRKEKTWLGASPPVPSIRQQGRERERERNPEIREENSFSVLPSGPFIKIQ
jgi:hypothetical protein